MDRKIKEPAFYAGNRGLVEITLKGCVED